MTTQKEALRFKLYITGLTQVEEWRTFYKVSHALTPCGWDPSAPQF